MLSAARALIDAGYEPVPLHGLLPDGRCGCQAYARRDGAPRRCETDPSQRGKHPILGGWQHSEADWSEIEALAVTYHAARDVWPNLGWRMGAQRNGAELICIDVDDSVAFAVVTGLPPTCSKPTPSGGKHLLYSVPDASAIGNSVKNVIPGADVRSDGGQIVIAPSVAGRGAYAGWDATPIAALPEEWVTKLTAAAPVKHTTSAGPARRIEDPIVVNRVRDILHIQEPDAPGSSSLTWRAAVLVVRQWCLAPAACVALLTEYNARSTKPLAPAQLTAKLTSAETKSDRTWGWALPREWQAYLGLPVEAIHGCVEVRLPLPPGPHAEPAPTPDPPPAWCILTGSLLGAPARVQAALTKWRGADPHRLPKPELCESAACLKWLRSRVGVTEADIEQHFGKEPERKTAPLQADRPVITTYGRPQCDVNDSAARLLRERCYTRGRQIVRITPSGDIVAQTSSSLMRHLVTKHAAFENWEGDAPVLGPPPEWLTSYLAAEAHEGSKPLHGVMRTPTVRADGTVWFEAGYQDGLELLATHPYEPMPAADALAVLREPFAEFPYEEACGESVALAAVLTLIARPMLWLNGCAVPAFAIDGPDGGVGKSLLGQVIAGCAGIELQPIAWSDDESELMKRVDAALFAGHQALKFDNARTGVAFGTPALDAYLTATKTVQSRVLGESTMRRVPWLCTAIVTGNQMAFAGESRRRFLRVRLSATKPLAYTRTSEALEAHVTSRRVEIINAGLSLLSTHLQAPTPGSRTIPSYEGWCRTVAACVERFTGVNPVQSQDSTAELANGAGELAEALERLATIWQAGPKTCSEAWAAYPAELRKLYVAQFPNTRADQVGETHVPALFRMLRDRPLGGRTLTRGNANVKCRTWIIR